MYSAVIKLGTRQPPARIVFIPPLSPFIWLPAHLLPPTPLSLSPSLSCRPVLKAPPSPRQSIAVNESSQAVDMRGLPASSCMQPRSANSPQICGCCSIAVEGRAGRAAAGVLTGFGPPTWPPEQSDTATNSNTPES